MASVVIVAAGSGLRMKSDKRKQYLSVSGLSIISRTIKRFDSCPYIDSMVLVVPQDDIEFCSSVIINEAGPIKPVCIVPGGGERHESVRFGLAAIPEKRGVVLIHDGVRPFVSDQIIKSCIDGAIESGACIPATQVSDTVKHSDDGVFASRTVSRSSLWLAQTPQAFDFNLIFNAHLEALQKKILFTDDASLLEEIGHKVRITQGSRFNIKITTPEDLVIAEAILPLFCNL